MTLSGWGGVVLGAGVTVALLLLSGPALGTASLRRPNRRGRQVSLVPGAFPAAAIVIVGAVRVLARPESVEIVTLLLATTFGLGGLWADAVGGPILSVRGLDAAGVAIVLEVGIALFAAGQLASGRWGVVSAALVILGFVAALRATWREGVAVAGGDLVFLVAALVVGGGRIVEAAAPGVAAAAVLAPLALQGRLLLGRAGTGTIGAVTGALVCVHSSPTARLAWAAGAIAVATLPSGFQRARQRLLRAGGDAPVATPPRGPVIP
jgi:hypothetical protein